MKRLLYAAAPAALVAAWAAQDIVTPARAASHAPVVDVWAWGFNRVGQLGSVPTNQSVPAPIGDRATWIAVSGGANHTLVLDEAGNVWAWGDNASGQLGDGTTASSRLPVQVAGLTGITRIAAGGAHSLAYRSSDDALWAWGSNSNGQLARPTTTTYSATPVRVLGMTGIVDVAAGSAHSVAATSDGTAWSWGANFQGQLGLGDFVERATPTALPSLSAVTAIGAGASHSLAITDPDGQVWTWGWNVFGQLGNGAQGTPDVGFPDPAHAVGVLGAVDVDGGGLHSVALTFAGDVWAWGYNTEGQVGNGDVTPADTGILTPERLTSITGVAQIATGEIHTVALDGNGNVWTWGSNQFGACGNNRRLDELLPVRAQGLTGAVAVGAGGKHSVALAPRAPYDRVTRLGSVGARPTVFPEGGVTLSGPAEVLGASVGKSHTLLLDSEHRVWAAGLNDSGQLGVSGGDRSDPALVDVPLDGARGFVAVTAGPDYSVALRSDGALWTWGDNSAGQLGTGDTQPRSTPARVSTIGDAVAVSAGDRHVLALDTLGQVWGWGGNANGQLGVAASADLALTPTLVPGIVGAVDVSAGGSHSVALDLVAGVLAWGSNFRAQLGRNDIADDHRPGSVLVDRDATAISAGRYHTLVLRSGGAAWAFGDGSYCQLGAATRAPHWVPVPTTLGQPSVAVSAGPYDSVAIGADGIAWGWGNEPRGALGGEPERTRHVCRPVDIGVSDAVLAAAGPTHTIVVSRSP